MKLIKYLMAGLAAMVIAGGFALSAQAIPITGMLNIAGEANFNTDSLLTASSATFINPHVESGTGSFAGLVFPTPVVMASYTFDPSTMTNGLWSVGGFTFNLTSSTVKQRTAEFLSVSGTGIITGPAGFDPTPGIWAFTSQNAGGQPGMSFSFSANTSAGGPVPDAGMTLALLGTGLMGLAAFRAKFGKG